MKHRITRLIAAFALTATVLASPARAEDVAIRVATPETPPSLLNLYLQVAYERGMFQKRGITVSKFMELKGGPLATQAVAGNQADVTATDAEGIMQAAIAGYPVRAVSSPAQSLAYMIVSTKDINSFADLKGQPVGVSRAGALTQYLFFPMLDKAGVPRNSVQWLSVGSSKDRLTALLAHRTKAGILYLEDSIRTESDPNLKPLARVGDVIPNYPHELLLIREDMIEKQPKVAAGIVAAIMEACRYMTTHKQDTLDIFAKYAKGSDPAITSQAYDLILSMKAWGVNGGMTEVKLNNAMNMALANKLIDAPIPLEKFADFSLQKAALAELGGPIKE